MDVVICNPTWTAAGQIGGVLAAPTATDLATTARQALIDRTELGKDDVDDVMLGNSHANTLAIGGITALDAGLGSGVADLQIDRRCGSWLQAVRHAPTKLGAVTPAAFEVKR